MDPTHSTGRGPAEFLFQVGEPGMKMTSFFGFFPFWKEGLALPRGLVRTRATHLTMCMQPHRPSRSSRFLRCDAMHLWLHRPENQNFSFGSLFLSGGLLQMAFRFPNLQFASLLLPVFGCGWLVWLACLLACLGGCCYRSVDMAGISLQWLGAIFFSPGVGVTPLPGAGF